MGTKAKGKRGSVHNKWEKVKRNKGTGGSSQRARQERQGRDRVKEGTEEDVVKGNCKGGNGGERRGRRRVAIERVDYVWRMYRN